jgi:hypothetical protein
MKEINKIGTDSGSEVVESNSTPKEVQDKPIMGRPKGAKNKDTLFKELMTGSFQETARNKVERTFEVLFEKAHEGDMKAIKLIMDRIVPVTKAVDLADMEKKGLTINISVGNMEDAQVQGEIIEDAEWEEEDDDEDANS